MSGTYWDKDSQQWVSHPPAGGATPPPRPPQPPPLPPQMPPHQPPYQPVEPPPITPRAQRPERPPSAGTPGSRRVLVAALAGALLGVLAGGGGYLLTRHDHGAEPTGTATLTGAPPVTATGSPSPTTTATPSPTPTTPTPTPTPTPTGPPFQRVQDRNGFTLLVPDGWQREEKNNSTFYRSPDRRSLVQVFAMGTGSPFEEASGTDAAMASDPATYPGYHRVRLERTADGAAELEYSYDNAETGTRRHAVDHVLVGPGGTAYALLVAGPEADWPTGIQALRDAELTGFCFAAQCPAATG
ncbi:hypothetical protein ACIRD3_36060 [Kitasatospora sp. NPDC093550]|uniref:hypothetical protein n=1 Tax=Kitasatospora sp. NPDC093550 TaxID=3364089 RepID=UPI003821F5A8